MENDYRNRFAFIAVFLIALAFGLGKIPLGIDLKGGAELIYSIEVAEDRDITDLVDRAINVIRTRIDPQGTRGYLVTPSEGRLLITMGGATNTEVQRVQRLLKKNGRLEMRLEVRPNGYRSQDFIKAAEALQKGLPNPVEDTHWYKLKDGRNLLIEDKVYLTGEMLSTASITTDPQDPSTWIIFLSFDEAKGGVDKLREISSVAFNNNKSGMAIILNDMWNKDRTELIRQGTCDSSPNVQGIFNDGRCSISGNYTYDEARELVTLLDSGSLPFSVVPESSDIVGPSLGQESIDKGLISCIVGLVLVFIFMFVYYRRLGLLADLCLAINLYIVWVGMSIFDFVLTLPGIAGVLLTIGMAVDANVLIFERIKEELREGYSLPRAIQSGYEKAFVTIFDSNLTTFLTGVVLYIFGSGAVRGFAVTLCLGIAASMFSAIYISRTVVDWLLETKRLTALNNKRLFNGEINFFGGLQKIAAIASIAAVGLGLSFVWNRGQENLGIDFVGGTRLQLSFREPTAQESVKTGAKQALTNEVFKYQGDVQVIPVEGPGGVSQEGYRRFIVKTKNINNEAVEEALITHFGTLLQPRSLQEEENTQTKPLKFVSFSFKTKEDQNRSELEANLRDDLSDPQLLLIENEPKDWTALVTPGRSLEVLQTLLVKSIGKRLEPENIRWNPDNPNEVTVALTEKRFIEDFVKEDILTLDPSFEGTTGKNADPEDPQSLFGDRIALTLPDGADRNLFAQQVLLTGLVRTSPINQGTFVNRMLHAKIRVFNDEDPESLQRRLVDNDFVLLGIDQKAGSERILHIGKTELAGDYDDLLAEITEFLSDMVSNPILANTTIGGTVAQEMSRQALWALLWSLVAIVIYISFRFEFRFGIISIVTLVHDVSICLGALALLKIEIDLTIVGALLTIVGYSLNDTIVIFDKIRENLRLWGSKPIREVINLSVNQTLSRTLLTSITTLVVVIVLNFYGGENLKPFSTALIIGLIVGTYSSIFVASSLLATFGSRLRSSLRPVKQEPPEEPGPEVEVLNA